jgi:hypothetical protein
VDGGKWHSPHSPDLALVFDNAVGTGSEPQRVADRMAATGLPSPAPAIPSTPDFRGRPRAPTAARRWVFDAAPRVVSVFRDEECKLLAV